jgi:monothiol glutaredoxin
VNTTIPMIPNESIHDDIAREIRSHRIVLFMKGNPQAPRCGFSAKVCSILGDLGVPYHSQDVLRSSALRDELKAFSNWPTFPQLYIDAQFVGGCDIVTELHQSGELGKLLGLGSQAKLHEDTAKTSEDTDYQCGRRSISHR